ncbi:MAG: DMT family transporter [Luteolibacter sp.]
MKHHLQLHALVFILAATALLGELISLPAASLVLWRTLLAVVGGGIWVAVVQRKVLWLGARRTTELIGVGGLIGCHWILFFHAIKVSNISICLAGLATIPLFTAFTEPVFERRRLRPFEILAGALVLCGILIVVGSVRRENLSGLGFALASAFLAAIFPLLNRKIVISGGSPLTMVTWEMAGACFAALALLPLTGEGREVFSWRGFDWFWLLVLALVCTVFAHGFHIYLLKHLSAFTINLAISFEPLYGILAAAFLFGEYRHLTPTFYAGLATIFAANVIHPICVRLTR